MKAASRFPLEDDSDFKNITAAAPEERKRSKPRVLLEDTKIEESPLRISGDGISASISASASLSSDS